MTQKGIEQPVGSGPAPMIELSNVPADLAKAVKFSPATDEDVTSVAQLRSGSDPWKNRGESYDDSLAALTKLRPFIHVAKLEGNVVGYFTVERDGPVPGAAYMRNIVVRTDLRKKGVGTLLLNQAMTVARDMYRKTIALRVDPSNAAAVAFYRNSGFTTVATVMSKKSGKLRLVMSREL